MAILERAVDFMRQVADPERHQRRLRDAYRRLFDSPEGRVVLADMAMRHGVLQTAPPYGPDGHVDAHRMAFQHGQRSVVLDLMRLVEEPLTDYAEVPDDD